MFAFKKLLAALLLPPLMPLLLVALGLLLLRRFPSLGRGLAWGGLLLAVLLSFPPVVNELASHVEEMPVLSATDLQQAQAIVILGGGVRRHAPEYGQPIPNRLTLERLRYGARLARQSGLPVLVTGGAIGGRPPEAMAMAEALSQDFGVTPRWLEAQALDTADNARFSAQMLKQEGVEHVVLVTHAVHMQRSLAEFRHYGLKPIAAPLGFLSDPAERSSFLDYLPSAGSSYTAWMTLHEWLGQLAQRLRIMISH